MKYVSLCDILITLCMASVVTSMHQLYIGQIKGTVHEYLRDLEVKEERMSV